MSESKCEMARLNTLYIVFVKNKATIYSDKMSLKSRIHWQNYLPFAKTYVLAGYEPVTTISFE